MWYQAAAVAAGILDRVRERDLDGLCALLGSDPAQAFAKRRVHRCEFCGTAFVGRPNRRYCSESCKVRAYERRKAARE